MNSTILFIPMILIFERDIIRQHAQSFVSLTFWLVMNLAGVFGFLIGIVTIAQISLTSPLTHNISGTAKAGVQTLVAYFFLGDPMSLRSGIGTALVLLGTFMYSLVRSREMDKEKRMLREKANFRARNTTRRRLCSMSLRRAFSSPVWQAAAASASSSGERGGGRMSLPPI